MTSASVVSMRMKFQCDQIWQIFANWVKILQSLAIFSGLCTWLGNLENSVSILAKNYSSQQLTITYDDIFFSSSPASSASCFCFAASLPRRPSGPALCLSTAPLAWRPSFSQLPRPAPDSPKKLSSLSGTRLHNNNSPSSFPHSRMSKVKIKTGPKMVAWDEWWPTEADGGAGAKLYPSLPKGSVEVLPNGGTYLYVPPMCYQP